MSGCKRKILSLCAAGLLLAAASPVSAKVVVDPVEIGLKVKNVAEIKKQIESLETISNLKDGMCNILGSDMCNALINQVMECTKGALKGMGKDLLAVDKDSLMSAASGCAGNLYISDCIDAGYDAMNDLNKIKGTLAKTTAQAGSKGTRLLYDADNAYTNALTGEGITSKIGSVNSSLDTAEGIYDQLGGGDVSKSYMGKAVQKLLNTATSPTKNIQLVGACTEDALDAADWVPSVTTLAPAEVAPTVPSVIKDVLTESKEGANDLISKAQNGYSGLTDGINDALGGLTGGISSGFDTINDTQKDYKTALSLYNKSDKAINRLSNAEGLGETLSGIKNASNVANQVGKKIDEKTGAGSFFDPLSETSGSVMDSAKGALSSGVGAVADVVGSGVDAVSDSFVGQAASSIGGGIKDGVEAGSEAATAGVKAVNDKVAKVEAGISGLVLAGMEKTADAAARAVIGEPTTIDEARDNQNKLQITALSTGIANGLKSSALVGSSGEELAEKQEKIKVSNNTLALLKQIAGLSAQSLQKNNEITALKAKMLEIGSLSSIVSEGILDMAAKGG